MTTADCRMNKEARNPNPAAGRIRACDLSFVIRHSLFVIVPLLLAGPGLAASGEAELELRPPHELLPPTFWEQYGWPVILGGVGVLILLSVGGWLLCRPKPPVPVPPEERARRALLALQNRSEDGAVLSAASQVVRRYVTEVFHLAPGELTTADFCRLIQDHDAIGPEVAGQLRDYLRECDRRKFAPGEVPSPAGSVNRALQLIEATHARHTSAELRTTAAHA
jgi:hypothetical protein